MNVSLPGPKAFARYVWDLRFYLLIIIGIFVVFYILGFLAVVLMPGLGDSVVSGFRQEVSPLKDLSPVGLMLGIFGNNAAKCFLVIVLGLWFGILPALFVLANGLILGIVIAVTLKSNGLFYVLVGVVPHGLIELPMVFISAAIGLKLGMDVVKMAFRILVDAAGVLSGAGDADLWKTANALLALVFDRVLGMGNEIVQALLIFFIWIFPLLFLAAFVETFVTGPILYLLFGGHG